MDPMLFGIYEEFMFGDKILVSPKRGDPAEPALQKTIENSVRLLISGEQPIQNSDKKSEFGQLVDLYLPQNALWYNYYNKQVHAATLQVTPEWIPDTEQGTYIRGGSILPILAHKRELSLL